MPWLSPRIRLDPFLAAIIAAGVVASLLRPRGVGADILSLATKVAIFFLFVYGARLHPREALAGLAHWRLHLTILSFTFVVFPLLGLALDLLSPWLVRPSSTPGCCT